MTEQTTTLADQHRECVQAIDAALTALETALTNHKEFRARVHRDEPEFDANCPALKFPIKLTLNPRNKPFQLCDSWRQWMRGCGCLKGGE